MTSVNPLDRVHDYLQQLTPQERNRLLLEMERLQLCGQALEGSDIVLKELRAEFRDNGQTTERLSNPSRFFFEPLQPALVDWAPERANAGQISRSSLPVIWEWIAGFLLPTMARDYSDAVTHSLASNNVRGAQQAAASFQSKVVKSLENMLSKVDTTEQARASFAKCTSSRASFDDLIKMLTVLRTHKALEKFASTLLAKIDDFEGEALTKVRGPLDALKAKHAEALPFALALLQKHLYVPWQLIRLATKAAASKEAAEIAATPYALGVSMVLDYLDERRVALGQALKAQRIPIAKDILVDIYDIEYALRVRIDNLDQSEWGTRLDQIMQNVAADLEKELHNIPDNLHHVLGSRSLHSHDTIAGRLTYFAWKGRDMLAAQPAYWKKMLGFGEKSLT
jgi:hypothetical protein